MAGKNGTNGLTPCDAERGEGPGRSRSARGGAANTRVGEVVRCFASTHRLSPRETQLLGLAVAGYNNDEAAELLGCSRATATTYWNRIFAKIGVRGQRDVLCALVRFVVRTGAVDRQGEPTRAPAFPEALEARGTEGTL